MNLRFVEAFYWVVSLKSVSRAAEKLFITQSAMSSRIAALEEELGVLLLDRRDKQFRLTVAGMRFFNHAQRLLALQREIKGEMGAGAGAQRAVTLRIGAIESVLHSWLIEWVQHMREGNPDFELQLTVETTPVLVDQVQRGALDLAFAALPTVGEGLRSRALPSMEMVFVGHAQLHRKRRYALADLAALDLLTFQRGSQPHVGLIDLFRGAGIELKRVHTISSISAMVQLVEGGFGVATLPLAAVQRLAGRLPLKPLKCEASLPPLPVHASYREDPSSSVAQGVVEAVLDGAGAANTIRPMSSSFNPHAQSVAEARAAIRRGAWTGHTSGLARDHVQGNVVILPKALADDFLRYCQRNPKPCPVLAVSEPGDPRLPTLGADIDIRSDVPCYRVWRRGELVEDPTDIAVLWRDDLVTFVIGCSFSFEQALLDAGLSLRHIDQSRNVAMFRTNIATEPAGPFHGPMVVSMRPLRASETIRAIQVTSRFPDVHGAPVHVGDPALIGIADLSRPDYGDAVEVLPDELPVFWACGVTPQAAIAQAKPEFCITHAPGAMLITDLLNHQLASF